MRSLPIPWVRRGTSRGAPRRQGAPASGLWLIFLLAVASSSASALTEVEWTGNGNTDLWNEAANWSPAEVPINNGEIYAVGIPNGHTVMTLHALGSFAIDSLDLGYTSSLDVVAGCTMSVLGMAGIDGELNASGGSFAADDPSAFISTEADLLATAGGQISLNAVESFNASTQETDELTISADGDAVIDLQSLQSIGSAGRGHTRMAATSGGEIDLGWAVSELGQVMLEASSGGVIWLGGEMPIRHASDRIYSSQSSHTTDLIHVDGVDSHIWGSEGVRSLDAGFDDQSGSHVNVHRIVASNGATLSLSNLHQITTPVRAEDAVEFVFEGGEIMIGSDDVIITGGGGLRLSSGSGMGNLTLGSLATDVSTTTIVTGTVRIDGDIALHGGSLLSVGPPGSYTQTSSLDVAGDMSFATTDPEWLRLGTAAVTFDGGPEPQFLEVGGLDVGTDTGALVDDNFGLGSLTVAQRWGILPSHLELVDDIDNGHRNGGREALYVFGTLGLDGLSLEQDCSLTLNGLDLYAYEQQAGGLVHINALFGQGESEIAYSNGIIYMPEPGGLSAAATVTLALLALRRRRARRAHPRSDPT